jgi:cell division protein FtsL
MLKLILTLTMSMLLCIALLQIRQQRLELNYETNRLHNQIRQQQSRLWSQQLQIAQYTAPNAISKTVGDQKLKMVPQTPLPHGQRQWIDARFNPDAE